MTTLDLDTLTLGSRTHTGPREGFNLMEAVAYSAGEKWTETPKCVCPVLGSFGLGLNDVLPDVERQRLVPLIPELIGTRGDGDGQVRSYMVSDWLIRTYLPAWLLVSQRLNQAHAAGLRALPPIVDQATAQAAGVRIRRANEAALAAQAAAEYTTLDNLQDKAANFALYTVWNTTRRLNVPVHWYDSRLAQFAQPAAWFSHREWARHAHQSFAWYAANAAVGYANTPPSKRSVLAPTPFSLGVVGWCQGLAARTSMLTVAL